MGLLEKLGLPPLPTTRNAPAAVGGEAGATGAAAQAKTVVTIVNRSGHALALVNASLLSKAASVRPKIPSTVPAGGSATFNIVAPPGDAKNSAGSARYHLDDADRDIDVTFLWAGHKASVKVAGEGTFAPSVKTSQDPAKGNVYELEFKEGTQRGDADDNSADDRKAGRAAGAGGGATGGGGAPGDAPADGAPASSGDAAPDEKPEVEPGTKVTLINRTGFILNLRDAKLASSDATFAVAPPASIGGGQTGELRIMSSDANPASFAGSVQYTFTPDSDDPEHPAAENVLTLDWAVSVWGGKVDPGSPDVKLEPGDSHDGKNYVFKLTGPKLVFEPPVKKAKQPTLRQGDKSSDGWVEYLQEVLNIKGAKLEVDGVFGGETLRAVKAFQKKFKKEGVLADGVVGDQTWSYLREGAPEKAKTDGRKAHSFKDGGVDARWVLEKNMLFYAPQDDLVVMSVISVGDSDKLEGRKARIRVIGPGAGQERIFDEPIGPPLETSKTDQGSRHNVVIPQLSTLFDDNEVSKGVTAPGDYQISAYLPNDVGGDAYSGVLTVAPP